MSFARTWVPKLPLVTTFTMSKTFMTRTTIDGRDHHPDRSCAIWGSVTRQKTCVSVAPSTRRRLERTPSGTALIAADRMTMAKPVWIQIRMTIKPDAVERLLLDEEDGIGLDRAVLEFGESRRCLG